MMATPARTKSQTTPEEMLARRKEMEAVRNFEVYEDEAAFAELKRRQDAEMARILRLLPALADPAPPVPLERVNGTFHMNVLEEWQALVDRWRAGTWQLPQADCLDGLVGPIASHGACLDPIRSGAGVDWYCPKTAARSGDFVLVELRPEVLQAMVERNAHKPEWILEYGRMPGPLVTKLLKRCGPDYYLLTRSSALPLGRNVIRGVLKHSLTASEYCAVGVQLIDIEAVNELVNVTVAGATITGTPISAGPGFFSEFLPLAEAQWENNTGETIDVRIEYSGSFATESLATGAFFSVWGEYDTGGSDTDDGVGKFVIRAVEPEYTSKAGSFVASVPNGATLSARIGRAVSAPSGTASATDFYHDGINVTVQAVKR
jgi:hypothetical protein